MSRGVFASGIEMESKLYNNTDSWDQLRFQLDSGREYPPHGM
eukprot:gene5447-biopygen1696